MEKSEELSAGRQNPILREYFGKQYRDLHGPKVEREPPPFVDRFIDLQIDHFLETVEQRLGRLQTNVNTLQQARARWIGSPATGQKQASAAFKQTLRVIEDDAGALRKTLALIFLELKGKGSSAPLIPDSDEGVLDAEVRFLSETIQMAEKRIRDYLFSSNPTVHVGDLQSKNMLVLLHEARTVARQLQKRL